MNDSRAAGVVWTLGVYDNRGPHNNNIALSVHTAAGMWPEVCGRRRHFPKGF